MTALFPQINITTRLEVSGLTMSRGDNVLFEGLNAKISSRDVLWVQGNNGIGKTTLLEALAGLARPDAGQITWLKGDTPTFHNNLVAYQPHLSFAKSNLSAIEDLTFWAKIYKSAELVEMTLKAVGLLTKQSVPTQRLSAGQRRRLALAKLIISSKPLWIMDEPNAAMDEEGVDLINELIKTHINRGGSAIIASHELTRKLSTNTRTLTLRSKL